MVGALPDWLVDEPGAPVHAATEVALRRALLPGHPLAFLEPPLAADAATTWNALVAAILPDAGDVDLVLRQATDTPGPAAATTRAAAAVASSLRRVRTAPALEGEALDHAARVVAAAAGTLALLGDSGWRSLVDQPLGVEAGGLGADAVAERTEAFDPLAVEVTTAA